jgi:transglutaminase-like putative cysteine protease
MPDGHARPKPRAVRRMGTCALALSFLVAAVTALAVRGEPMPPSPAQVAALVERGDFAAADAAIATALESPSLAAGTRQEYLFERERMRRIRLDFPLTRAQMEVQLRHEVPDLSAAELAAWDRDELLERYVIDGEPRYFVRAVPNLFRVSTAARARRRADAPRARSGPMESVHPHHREVIAQARAGGRSGAARRVRVTQSLTVVADAVPAGTRLRAWIPFPRPIDGQQTDIVLHATQPAMHEVAPASTLQRTIHLERAAVGGTPTTFSIDYELTVHGLHHPLVPGTVVQAVASPAATSELRPYLAERPPHVVFTPALRAYSRRVVGDAAEPLEIARRLFAAVDAIPWGSAREYSTIGNLSDYALHRGHADCGQQTLLLIALLRLNGIPAAWQSGMVFSDGDYDNLHDWGRLWLPGRGWLPMDVTTGALASDDPALRDFYLGSLDAYRIAFNDDWSQPFVPAKRHPRSDTVDSQRGEVEWDGGNLYYDQWDYDFSARVLPSTTGG